MGKLRRASLISHFALYFHPSYLSHSGVGVRVYFLQLLLAILVTLTATPSQAREAGLDYRLGFGGRSLPFGGAGYGQAGYSIPLWGEWAEPNSVLYGFLRPATNVVSAVTYNSADFRLEFYPISFLGIAVGQTHVYRPETRSESVVNCEQFECGGKVTGEYLEVDMVLAYQAWFMSSKAYLFDVRIDRDGSQFYEDGETVIGEAGGDRFHTLSVSVGRSIENTLLNKLKSGFAVRRSKAQGSGDFSRQINLFVNHDAYGLNWTYAIGEYQNGRIPPSLQLALVVEWVPQQGLLLK